MQYPDRCEGRSPLRGPVEGPEGILNSCRISYSRMLRLLLPSVVWSFGALGHQSRHKTIEYELFESEGVPAIPLGAPVYRSYCSYSPCKVSRKTGGLVSQPANCVDRYIQGLSTHRRGRGRGCENQRKPVEGETPDQGLRTRGLGTNEFRFESHGLVRPSLGHLACS